MYFTKVILKKSHNKSIEIITDLQETHRFVMSGFQIVDEEQPRKELGILYASIYNENETSLLIQSAVLPKENGFDHPYVESVRTMDIDQLIEHAAVEGRTLRFRTTVNATSNRTGNNGRYAYRITRKNEFDQWLRKKMEGCQLLDWRRCNRNISTVTRRGTKFDLYCDTIEGAVTITNADEFKAILKNGIGKSKAYGCGLILIA